MIAPDALRPWALAPSTSRALRAMLGVEGGRVAVVLLPGALPPELAPGQVWRTVEGRPVAVVDLGVALRLAAARSPSAHRALTAPPPLGGAWCLALAADGSALTWSTPTTPPMRAWGAA